MLEGPRVTRLLIELPLGLSDRGGPHQTAGIEIVQSGFAFALFDPIAHPRGIDSGIDYQMCDMNIPGPSSRAALWATAGKPNFALANAA